MDSKKIKDDLFWGIVIIIAFCFIFGRLNIFSLIFWLIILLCLKFPLKHNDNKNGYSDNINDSQ